MERIWGGTIKVIIFDFDDTLVHTNPIFDEAKNKFYNIMKDLELHDDDLLDKLNYFDILNINKHGGFAKECFPNALVQTYQYYCDNFGKKICTMKMKEIEDLGWEVLSKKPELINGAKEILEYLMKSYRLFLITKGDKELQTIRVTQSGVASYFESVFVVMEKNEELFKRIITDHAVISNKSWSIGNSMKADINPALLAGLNCIHIKTSAWDFEHAEPIGDYYAVNELRDIKNIIKIFE